VSLIEKAVSKIFGSYEDMTIANLGLKDAFTLITGAPSLEISLSSVKDNKEYTFNLIYILNRLDSLL
jgi:hypothetical protein